MWFLFEVFYSFPLVNYRVSWPWVQGTGHLHSDVGMGHWFCGPMPHVCCASTAACSIRNHFGWITRPGTRHRKEVPDEVKSSMSSSGWGRETGNSKTRRQFVCHLPSRPLTSHPWLEILCRKWTFTWWKKLFPTPKFHHMFVFQETLNFYLNWKATDDTFCLG